MIEQKLLKIEEAFWLGGAELYEQRLAHEAHRGSTVLTRRSS